MFPILSEMMLGVILAAAVIVGIIAIRRINDYRDVLNQMWDVNGHNEEFIISENDADEVHDNWCCCSNNSKTKK